MATYIVGAVVIMLLIMAGYKLYKDKKRCGCSGGCAGCAYRKKCNKDEKQ